MFDVKKCLVDAELESLAYFDVLGTDLNSDYKISEFNQQNFHVHMASCDLCNDIYEGYLFYIVEFNKAACLAESGAEQILEEEIDSDKIRKYINEHFGKL